MNLPGVARCFTIVGLQPEHALEADSLLNGDFEASDDVCTRVDKLLTDKNTCVITMASGINLTSQVFQTLSHTAEVSTSAWVHRRRALSGYLRRVWHHAWNRLHWR